MKRLFWGPFLILCMTLAASMPSHAAFIDVRTSAAAVQPAAAFDVIFSVSGLTGAANDSLAGFDMDVLFDPAFASFVSAAFGAQLDLPEAGAFPFFGDAAAAAGRIDVFALSGNSSAVLDNAQAGAFDFLTLRFMALAATPLTSFSIDLADSNLLFVDGTGADLSTSLRSSTASVSIGTTTPPVSALEPGAALLLLIGIVLLLISLMRARQSTHRFKATEEFAACL